jgi:queuine/archaeosine tRNA-ribosyltransferase
VHNLTYYQRLMTEARRAIEAGRFLDFHRRRMAGWSAPLDAGESHARHRSAGI